MLESVYELSCELYPAYGHITQVITTTVLILATHILLQIVITASYLPKSLLVSLKL